jgi:hypothetical protein
VIGQFCPMPVTRRQKALALANTANNNNNERHRSGSPEHAQQQNDRAATIFGPRFDNITKRKQHELVRLLPVSSFESDKTGLHARFYYDK